MPPKSRPPRFSGLISGFVPQTKFDREMRRMRLDRDAWQAQLEDRAAKKIQGAWHALLARRRAKAERERRARIAKATQEMNDLEIENTRKRLIYEEQVVDWYARALQTLALGAGDAE